jgi:hypothetical protein
MIEPSVAIARSAAAVVPRDGSGAVTVSVAIGAIGALVPLEPVEPFAAIVGAAHPLMLVSAEPLITAGFVVVSIELSG